MRRLELLTSPRSTWVWAPDLAENATMRGTLEAADIDCCPASESVDADDLDAPAADLARAIDVEIGVTALAALEALAAAGYDFAWHPTQPPHNRWPDLFGVPVAPLVT